MHDYQIWWALFVFFAVLVVLAIQYQYRRWRRARRLLIELTGVERAEQAARLRREGWRLVLMTVSLAAMTALVFAVLLGGPPALLVSLRLLALFAVLGVLVLSLRV